MRIYEPPGMFQVKTIPKPWLCQGAMWFTQTLTGIHQIHVGYFDVAKSILYVWKSRNIRPKIKRVKTGVSYHARNPVLDREIFEEVIRIPFLYKTVLT
jgi:hypothetical protein